METKPILPYVILAIVIITLIAAMFLPISSNTGAGKPPAWNATRHPQQWNNTLPPPVLKASVNYSALAVCGNGVCEVDESGSCDADCSGCRGAELGCFGPGCYYCRCNSTCGNGYCEECEDCQQDCGYCGDGVCQTFKESREGCNDCVACGDGYCSCSFESPETCSGDCQGASQDCLTEYANSRRAASMIMLAQCPDNIAPGMAALSIDLTVGFHADSSSTSKVTIYRELSPVKSVQLGVATGGLKMCILVTAGEKYVLEAWLGSSERGTYGSSQEPIVPQDGKVLDIAVEMNQVVY